MWKWNQSHLIYFIFITAVFNIFEVKSAVNRHVLSKHGRKTKIHFSWISRFSRNIFEFHFWISQCILVRTLWHFSNFSHDAICWKRYFQVKITIFKSKLAIFTLNWSIFKIFQMFRTKNHEKQYFRIKNFVRKFLSKIGFRNS